MIFFFCKKLPTSPTLLQLEGIKFCAVFLADPLHCRLHLVKCCPIFNKTHCIIQQFNQVHIGQRLFTCKDQGFNVRYYLGKFHASNLRWKYAFLSWNSVVENCCRGCRYPFSAAAPLTISVSSVVMAACLARL